MAEPFLRVEGLKKYFPVTKGLLLERTVGWVKAVDNVSFSIQPQETLSLVGESGCGKTTISRLILRLLKPTSGSIWFRDQDITKLNGDQLRGYRSCVRAVFQDPYSSLDSRMQVGSIVAEPLKVNRPDITKNERQDRVSEVLLQVGLDPGSARLYPHEFSGGQRQRIAVARALALDPQLIVLDEPVSALDVSIRAQVMNLLRDLQIRLGVAYLLIAHHLGTVRYISHRVAVMYLGAIVELAPGEELFTNPLHPYTKALLSAALPSHPSIKRERIVLPGEVPSPINLPPGCRFHTRCPQAMKECGETEPEFRALSTGHWVVCHL